MPYTDPKDSVARGGSTNENIINSMSSKTIIGSEYKNAVQWFTFTRLKPLVARNK
jgi:hypothetical protein